MIEKFRNLRILEQIVYFQSKDRILFAKGSFTFRSWILCFQPWSYTLSNDRGFWTFEGSDVDDESIESYNESDGEIKEVFVDPIAPQAKDMRPTLANFLITGGESGQKSNPLAGMADADQFASDM